jgi:hypothetical protein
MTAAPTFVLRLICSEIRWRMSASPFASTSARVTPKAFR